MTKVAIFLGKVVPEQWGSLESKTHDVYPSSSKHKKDWDKLASKEEHEQSVDELFAEIYKNASDDARRAMNKSFIESGGTVLSTNWQEVGKGRVRPTPPEGTEARELK